VYAKKLFVGLISLNGIDLSLFKDKTKPIDKDKFPEYLAQKVLAVPIPMSIERVNVNNLSLTNKEKKPDGKYAQVHITKGKVSIHNITNMTSKHAMSIAGSALLEKAVALSLKVVYSYRKPQFSFDVKVKSFNLSSLNSLLANYVPAQIKSGIVDEIVFKGNVEKRNASGTMKFLYHDLKVDLAVKDKNWQNSLITFGANTYLNQQNPVTEGKPPRIVECAAQRDMNKGGFNILLKCFLNGMKETMIMSKENKESYKAAKKESKKAKEPKIRLFQGKNKVDTISA